MDDAFAQKRDDAAGGHDAGPDGEHGVGKPPSKQRRNQRARPCTRAGQGDGDEKIEPQADLALPRFSNQPAAAASLPPFRCIQAKIRRKNKITNGTGNKFARTQEGYSSACGMSCARPKGIAPRSSLTGAMARSSVKR